MSKKKILLELSHELFQETAEAIMEHESQHDIKITRTAYISKAIRELNRKMLERKDSK